MSLVHAALILNDGGIKVVIAAVVEVCLSTVTSNHLRPH